MLVSVGGRSFALDGSAPEREIEKLREAHAAARTAAR
jgi:hypothetical protein